MMKQMQYWGIWVRLLGDPLNLQFFCESEKPFHEDFKNTQVRDFSGGPVVQNASSNTGDLGLIPGWGANIPRTAGQLSLFDATKEACMLQ